MKSFKKGYTLTEILIVVVIIATMAALVLPRMLPQTERADAAEAIQMLSAIRQAEAAFFLEKSVYATDLLLLDIDDPNANVDRKFNYTFDNAAGVNAIIATAQNGIFVGQTIRLKMDGTWCPNSTHPYAPK